MENYRPKIYRNFMKDINDSQSSQSTSSIADAKGIKIQRKPTGYCMYCKYSKEKVIKKSTVFKTEFRFRHLNPDDEDFVADLKQQCSIAEVCGYIIFNYDRDAANGELEGSIKDMNKVKDWVERLNKQKRQSKAANFHFSWFMVSREPMKLKFEERSMPPPQNFSDSSSTD